MATIVSLDFSYQRYADGCCILEMDGTRADAELAHVYRKYPYGTPAWKVLVAAGNWAYALEYGDLESEELWEQLELRF